MSRKCWVPWLVASRKLSVGADVWEPALPRRRGGGPPPTRLRLLMIASCEIPVLRSAGLLDPLWEPDLDLEEPVRRRVGRDVGGDEEVALGQCLVRVRLAVCAFERDLLSWCGDEAEDPADRGLAACEHERRRAAAWIGHRHGYAAALAGEIDRVLVDRRRAGVARRGESEYGAQACE